MKYGLSESDFKILQDLVLDPLKKMNVDVYVFGSRATGKHHPFSDIDLLLAPKEKIPAIEFSRIKELIEESRFPIKVDFVLLDELAKSYREQVLRERILI